MALTFDPARCRADLDAFERLLAENPDLSERAQILPFVRAHSHLSLLLGVYNPGVVAVDILAYELSLFGQFTADVVVGDWRRKRYCLVEFEYGKRNIALNQARGYPPRLPRVDARRGVHWDPLALLCLDAERRSRTADAGETGGQNWQLRTGPPPDRPNSSPGDREPADGSRHRV